MIARSCGAGSTLRISTVAGTGTGGFTGDGGQATAAQINQPRGVSTNGSIILIPDSGNARIRSVSSAGTITTIAGGGATKPGLTAISATSALLGVPFSVAVMDDGSLLVADRQENEVDRVTIGGMITRVAGLGVNASVVSAGDGGAATVAAVSLPHSVERAGQMAPDGFLIVEMVPTANSGDYANNRVRCVAADGTISTVVNISGIAGSGGDGAAATAAQINGPRGIAVRADGSFLIAEFGPPDASGGAAGVGGDRIRLVFRAA